MAKPTSKHRWSKFTWESWRADPALRLCSIPARGWWMELLCLAHEGNPFGHVTVNGEAPSVEMLCALAGGLCPVTPEEVTAWVAELERHGVLSRTQEGVIFSRRMVRDFEAFKAAQKSGRRGGNPILLDKKSAKNQTARDKATLNPTLNGGDKAPLKLESESDIYCGASHPKSTRSVGQYLPEGWTPSMVGRAYAVEWGLNVDREVESFRDYWRAASGSKARKRDWDAAWRTWCQNAVKFGGAKPAPAKADTNYARKTLGSFL